ncbi:MAG: 50S ribosomal protein L21 [Blastocatellia bacterium]
MSYAIIRSGGKQFRVSPGEIVRVPSISGKNEGDSVHFTDVLVAGGDSGLRIGAPTIDGAVVTGTIVKNGRGPKILVFKFKRRKGFKKMKGHRQDFTAVKIESIA